MNTVSIPKSVQYAHRAYTYLGRKTYLGVTPYEVADPNGPSAGAESYYILSDRLLRSKQNFVNNSSGTPRVRPDSDVTHVFDGDADLKLVSATAQGNGWEFQFESRGRSNQYSNYESRRGIGSTIFELRSAGKGQWECWTASASVAGMILKHAGIDSDLAPNGESDMMITAGTPDAFFDELVLPQMPYMNWHAADNERQAWKHLIQYGYIPTEFGGAGTPTSVPQSDKAKLLAIQSILGYPLKDAPGIGRLEYVDPFSGFANYRDSYTITPGELMEPVYCNPNHMLYKANIQQGIGEILANHLKANGGPFNVTFSVDTKIDDAFESDVLHFELSGSVKQIFDTACQHGVYRWWFDSNCGFHFIPDYCTGQMGQLPVALKIVTGPSLIGNLKISLASKEGRVNRAAVRGQALASFSNSNLSAMDSYFGLNNAAVFPAGRKPGLLGPDSTMENYLGALPSEQARRMFFRDYAESTFSWEGFPYPNLALACFNRVITVDGTDPKGQWDFHNNASTVDVGHEFHPVGGKAFVCTGVKFQLKEPNNSGGGYYDCSISGKEIITAS